MLDLGLEGPHFVLYDRGPGRYQPGVHCSSFQYWCSTGGPSEQLNGQNIELAQRLEKAILYGDEVRTVRAKVKVVEKEKEEVEAWI